MNKTFRKLTVLVLAMAMLLSMSVMAFADEVAAKDGNFLTFDENHAPTANGLTVENVDSFKLVKKFNLTGTGENTEEVASATAAEGTLLPTTPLVFTFSRLGVYNVGGKYDSTPMPMLKIGKTEGETTTYSDVEKVTFTPTGTNASYEQVITLPDYEVPGDYWYQVEETNNKSAAVQYATNSATTDACHYYIHVQVLNNPAYPKTEGSKPFLRSVTMHTNHPAAGADDTEYNNWVKGGESATYDNYKTGVKVEDVVNKYSAGTLSIQKVVTGNAGDKNKDFKVTVTFTKPTDTHLDSIISYKVADGEPNAIAPETLKDDGTWDNGGWTNGKATVEITLTHGQTVKFTNIPFGVEYTFAEADYTTVDGGSYDLPVYEKTTTETDDDDTISSDATTAADRKVDGKIDDASDAYTITNNKQVAIDVGVITESAPFVAILVVAFTAVVIYSRRRKNMIEE